MIDVAAHLMDMRHRMRGPGIQRLDLDGLAAKSFGTRIVAAFFKAEGGHPKNGVPGLIAWAMGAQRGEWNIAQFELLPREKTARMRDLHGKRIARIFLRDAGEGRRAGDHLAFGPARRAGNVRALSVVERAGARRAQRARDLVGKQPVRHLGEHDSARDPGQAELAVVFECGVERGDGVAVVGADLTQGLVELRRRRAGGGREGAAVEVVEHGACPDRRCAMTAPVRSSAITQGWTWRGLVLGGQSAGSASPCGVVSNRPMVAQKTACPSAQTAASLQ
ncbi:MAG: hypothetical protein EBY24_06570 [Betaproteobacteria bacterium]|nr:hypothetical protein [Betaproteobacteria bacterium]